MATSAVLPVKRFVRAKQRLATSLRPGGRAELASAMLSDVLDALEGSAAVETVVVVSSEPAVRSLVRDGKNVLVPDLAEKGQSAAALAGIARAMELGCERALLVPADCPLIDPRALDELADDVKFAGLDVVIVPDRHRLGTNALLVDPDASFEPLFGPDSLSRHVEQAKRRGLRYAVQPVASLALDVDTREDLAELVAVLNREPARAPHTRSALRRLAASESLAVPA